VRSPAVEIGVTARRRHQLPSATGYPRVCGQCGQAFLAQRTTARWCSDRCRLRAWRHAARAADRGQIERLQTQVKDLHRALRETQQDNLCASAGCQNATPIRAGHADHAPDRQRQAAPWRGPEWNDPAVRALREQLTNASHEIDRLRDENRLMRRWIHQRLEVDNARTTGR
jgi:hypothetical protein